MNRALLILMLMPLSIPHAGAWADTMEIVLQPSDDIRRGNDYIKAGQISEARQAYSRALKANITVSQQANAYNGLCIADLREELWEAAMTHCDMAIDLVSYNWRYYNNRGNVYLGLGQYKKAMEQYEKGLRYAPKSSTIRKNIALAQSRVDK